MLKLQTVPRVAFWSVVLRVHMHGLAARMWVRMQEWNRQHLGDTKPRDGAYISRGASFTVGRYIYVCREIEAHRDGEQRVGVSVGHVQPPQQPAAAPPEVRRKQHDEAAVQRHRGDGHVDGVGAGRAAGERRAAAAAGAVQPGACGGASGAGLRALGAAVAELRERLAEGCVREDQACGWNGTGLGAVRFSSQRLCSGEWSKVALCGPGRRTNGQTRGPAGS